MADPVRVALVGCGRHARSHLMPAIRESSDLVLTAAVDIDQSAAQQVSDGAVEIYADTSAMAASGVADAAVIAVPHDVLANTALTCISAGQHVFVETPLARTRAEAETVLSAAAKQSVVVMPGYCLRFHPTRIQARTLLTQGVTGHVVSISAIKAGPPLTSWITDPSPGGGHLDVIGCHLIDQILWLHQEKATTVTAHTIDRDDTGGDDTTSLLLAFNNDVRATLVVSQASGTHIDEIHFVGRSGRVRTDIFTSTTEVTSTTARAFETPATFHHVGNSCQEMFSREMADFGRAIRQGIPPGITGLDAIRTLAVMEAARESSNLGTPVHVEDPWEKHTSQSPPRDRLSRVRLQFTYPSDKIQSSLVDQLARRFDLRFDIRRADVDAGIGWVQLLLEGESDELEAAVEWAEQQGIRVDPVEGEVATS